MPTYEYGCTECGHRFEVFQKITDRPKRKCPECGGRAERLISGGAGLVFKGSGFYATDYKKAEAGKKDRDGADGATEGKSGSKKDEPGKSGDSD